jgi:hypothetical protein
MLSMVKTCAVSLDSNMLDGVRRPTLVNCLRASRILRFDSHRQHSFSSSTTADREETAITTIRDENVRNNIMLSSQTPPVSISESTTLRSHASNDRSISRSSFSNLVNHLDLTLTKRRSSTDNDNSRTCFVPCLLRGGRLLMTVLFRTSYITCLLPGVIPSTFRACCLPCRFLGSPLPMDDVAGTR